MDKRNDDQARGNYVSVRKGNQLMRAKFKSSLLENQLIAIATAKLPYDGSNYAVDIYPEELQRLIKRQDNHGIYNRLKTVADNLTRGYNVFMENGENFASYVLIKTAEYEDGIFHIHFNEDLGENGFLSKLKNNYTAYPLANILNFESTYSLRLYEIIRSYAWKCRDGEPAIVRYDIDELKCMIGIVDTGEIHISKLIKEKRWSEAVKEAENKTYGRWNNFKKYVLDKAMIEIKDKCDYYFEYTLERGNGRKYQSIVFIIRKNIKVPEELKDELMLVEGVFNSVKPDVYENRLPDMLKRYVGHNKLTEKDLMTFYMESDKNLALVEEAILSADDKTMNPTYVIDNYPGWIRSYIRKGGYQDQAVVMGSAERGDNLVQIKNDMEELGNDQDFSEKMSARYWEKAKENNHEKFQEFVSYLGANSMTLSMFEVIHSPAECGDIFIDFVKNGSSHLI